MKLGTEVRRRRKALGLTLDDLAERSGLSPHYLSTLENGHRDPHLSTIVAVARGLRVTPSELLAPTAGAVSQPQVGALYERAPEKAKAAIHALLELVVAPVPRRARPKRKKKTTGLG